MIIFDSLEYKNFLSVGNQSNIIELNKTITTIITGTNGAGKSTFIDALVYALFGKPFRKVRLGQLLNNINNSNLIVEIRFSINSKKYVVKRGMKPSIFEIWVDGEMIPQPAETKDYQAILEHDILKINYKSFTQIIVLGSASFKPFMQQKLAIRREIIEDLLDISVFSHMNTILKSKIKDIKTEIIDIDHKLDITKERYTSKRNYLLEATEDHKKRIAVVEGNITDTVEMINIRNTDVCLYNESISKLKDRIDELIDIEDKIKVINDNYNNTERNLYNEQGILDKWREDNVVIKEASKKIITCADLILELHTRENDKREEEAKVQIIIDGYNSDIDEDIAVIEKEIILLSNDITENKLKLKFYQDNENCPECKQEIEQLFRDNTIVELSSLITKSKDKCKKLEQKLEQLNNDKKDLLSYIKKSNEIARDITGIGFDIDKWKNSIDIMKESIEMLTFKSESDIIDKKKVISDLSYQKDECGELAGQYKEQYNKLTILRKDLTDMQQELALTIQARDSYIKNNEALTLELKELKETHACSITQDDIDKLTEEVKTFDKTLGKKKHILHYFGIVQRLLKDDGLKTKIINKFLPIINATVNMYLDKFDFPINFEFDENFNENIQSNFRSDFSYYSFSEGEKSRIDLALLFTWREISLKKSRNSSNIIIFDEIFDGSLDGCGIENFMDILGVDKDGYSSFIITHKEETINSRFDRNLDFTKDGHFSKMMEK